jgi:hypothetical protein
MLEFVHKTFKRCITPEFTIQLTSRDYLAAHDIHTGMQYAARDCDRNISEGPSAKPGSETS